MAKVDLFKYSDLLAHAVSLGYDHNDACDFMDSVRPQYEIRVYDFEEDQIDDPDYEYCDKFKHVMRDFMKTHELTEFKIC
jgi:hypothetical protein